MYNWSCSQVYFGMAKRRKFSPDQRERSNIWKTLAIYQVYIDSRFILSSTHSYLGSM